MSGASERIGVAVFTVCMLLLPRWLRERAGEEMIDVFRARHRGARGPLQTLAAWLVEIRGVGLTAVRARLDADARWTGRGARPSPNPRRNRMDSLSKDLRFALRTLGRRPTTTAVAILTLGLGVAASTAMFSVVDAVLLARLPYPEPDRVVRVYSTNPSMEGHPTLGDAAQRGVFSPPEYTDLVGLSGGVFESFAVAGGWGSALLSGLDGRNERIPVGMATYALLGEVLGIRPLVGRLPVEDDVGRGRRLVLTEGFWTRRFGRDPGVVGSTLTLNGNPYEVLGVIPASAELPGTDWDVEAWSLLTPNEDRGNHSWYGFARLADGMTPERASEQLTTAFRDAVADNHDHGVNVFPERAEQIRGVEGPLLLLTAASFLLLLVACGNVAVLLVGVALDRQAELAVRAAMGASRGRLFQQLLTEALVLSGAGALVGVGLAAAVTRGLVFLAPAGVPRMDEAGVDLTVLSFAAGAALVCGILAGILPSMAFSRESLRGSLGTARGGTDNRARLQGTVVVAEIALATVLLVGGGLLVRTVLALRAIDPGFDADRTLSVAFSFPTFELLEGIEGDSARYFAVEQIQARIADEVAALPGVEGASYTSVVPLSPGRGNNYVNPDGVGGEDDRSGILAERRFVTPGYFETMGIDLVEGRTFTQDDDRFGGPGVMILSEGLAQQAWAERSAVGRRMDYWGRETTVIGVVANVNDEEIESDTDYAFYVPTHQADQRSGTMIVRTSGDPTLQIPAVRQRIWSVVPAAAIYSVRPMEAWISDQIAAERYRARLAMVFALLAGFFSVMGIYAVTSRTVSARTREIGIRMALGAERGEVLGRVLIRAGRLALFGAAAGMLASFVAARFVAGFLFGVEPLDPLTLFGVAGAMGVASVAAAYAPGRRATRIDPVTALKVER